MTRGTAAIGFDRNDAPQIFDNTVTVTGLLTAAGGTAQTGTQTVTSGNVTIGTAGNGLQIKEGTNARMGTLTLTGATPVVVPNTTVTANTRIFLTTNSPAGTPAFNWVSARTAGTSFSVTGTAGDTSVVAWLLVEPA